MSSAALPTAPLRELDALAVRAWLLLGRDALAQAREQIDALNVYPVADGDTGTNLHLTVASAVAAADGVNDGAGLAEVLSAVAQGALLGARGNSGVILSQLLRGFAEPLDDAPAGGRAVASALRSASVAAYEAVAAPVEGTMLTVSRAAAEAVPGDVGELAEVVVAAASGAWEALARTPDQLDVLARAGVVDAGAMGVCVLLDALAGVVSGVVPEHADVPAARARPETAVSYDDARTGPAYEVMFLLDADRTEIPTLRRNLAALGDSLLVVGGEPTWNVHVHVDDVGAAVEAGIEAGRPHRIRVTDLRETQHLGQPAPGTRGVVSVVAGDGLATLFETAGATVVRGGPGGRASTAELLDGLRRAGASEIVVLPNDADSLAVAEAAAGQARAEGLRVAVVPTRATVQALAALAVHDAGRRFDDDVVQMTAAAGHCRHGGVTVAAREAVTMAGVCQPGDVLGVIDGDFAVIGDSLSGVACAVVDRMLGSGGELVTLVTGAGSDAGLSAAVVAHLRHGRPEIDAVVYDGGQPRYPLLVGVE